MFDQKLNMHQKNSFLLALGAIALSLLSGCGGSGQVKVTEGDQQIGAAPTGSTFVTHHAVIVHVDSFERLATLRNARGLEAHAFLQTMDSAGNKTATLKARDNRTTGLRTADILEGSPKINDHAVPVSAAESARLGKIYRDPAAE